MKQLHIFRPKQLSISIIGLFILASCSSDDEPEYPVFMQPASIMTTDATGDNQTFEYDDYGRIISWNCASNNSNSTASYSAHYSYPDENTIKVTSEELILGRHYAFEETIQLKNGRASQSEGTFILSAEANAQMRKTYRLIFNYLPSNHLNTVEHLEVTGIGDDIKDNAWDNAWRWTNYLVWENGNLKEFQDCQGNAAPYQTTKYEYSDEKVAYPVIIPAVINSAHHLPLYMQRVFGLTSVNLVTSASSFDRNDNLYLSKQYSYELEEDRISKYTQTFQTNSTFSNPITYTVIWTEK